MTLVFSKRNGNIKGIFSGDLQTMDVLFGEDAEDYKMIWDEVVLKEDNYVIQNVQQFKINIETKELEMIPVVNNYPLAQT